MKKIFKGFINFIKENWVELLCWWAIFFLQFMGYFLVTIIYK